MSCSEATCRLISDFNRCERESIVARSEGSAMATVSNSLTVDIADPSDLATIDSLSHLLKSEINLQVASEQDIEAALGKYYGGSNQTAVDTMIQELTEGNVEAGKLKGMDDDSSVVEADAPLIRLVNQMIVDAFKVRASDIHLEPLVKSFRLRYRIDGMLHEMKSPPKRLQASIIAWLKIQSNMSIAEHLSLIHISEPTRLGM